MYEYIQGKLIDSSPLKATLDVAGVGYSIFIPLSTYSKLPHQGSQVLLYTSFVVREDAHRLFGFLKKSERDLFEKFTEISGIGPKTALALIGHLDVSDLQLAVEQSNIALISKVPGIGKKTAERLIIEMRGKVKNLTDAPMVKGGTLASDAIAALVNLGYNPLLAQKSVNKALEGQPAIDLGSLLTLALRSI